MFLSPSGSLTSLFSFFPFFTPPQPSTQVADYTLKLLRRRVPPAVPGIMFLSGGQSELEATLNLNAMNQSPNPWHVSFSYARALQNSVLRTWQGEPANLQKAQEALLVRAKANSDAQKGKREEFFFEVFFLSFFYPSSRKKKNSLSFFLPSSSFSFQNPKKTIPSQASTTPRRSLPRPASPSTRRATSTRE